MCLLLVRMPFSKSCAIYSKHFNHPNYQIVIYRSGKNEPGFDTGKDRDCPDFQDSFPVCQDTLSERKAPARCRQGTKQHRRQLQPPEGSDNSHSTLIRSGSVGFRLTIDSIECSGQQISAGAALPAVLRQRKRPAQPMRTDHYGR